MGRHQKRSWGGGRGHGGGGGRGDNTWRQDKRPKKDIATTREEMSNGAFEDYYRAQGIVPDGEWDAFLATLRRPLPVTFRINGSGKFADHLRDKLQQDFFAQFGSGELMVDGEAVLPPKQLPWYPNGYAWQLEFSRHQLRKLPLLASIHEFVVHANEAGSISRQEAVSMVPPLFLDVQPHHKVLDMCAAPGSKTFQLLEALHANCLPGQTPPGYVVANDADFMRCNLLTHQTKRVCSPCLLVTNHNAERFPVYLSGPAAGADEYGKAAAAAAGGGGGRVEVRFDRILADVPCSGDGTLRKSPDIWRRWNLMGGNSLHPIQLKIALHGARLLQVGGRMVYSTCSFNPVENEAVVAELLLRCKGALELVDVSSSLPELRRMPGMHTWKVRDRHGFYESWDEAKTMAYKLHESMFSSPAKAALPLERCMRFLPHHGDTGGFFVVVLQKVAELPADLLGKEAEQGEGEAEEGPAPEGPEGAEADGEDAPAEVAAVDGDGDGQGEGAAAMAVDGEGAAAAGPAAAAEGGAAAAAAPSAVDVTRAAAEAAVKAAEAALAAMESGDTTAAGRAAATADVSAQRAMEAANKGKLQQQGQGTRQDRAQHRRKQQQEPRPQPPPPPPPEADADADGDAEVPSTSGSAPAGPQASWIRGGGGRGRHTGGKFIYLDPVAPMEDEAVLSALYAYYGMPTDFPLRQQLLRRALEGRAKRLYFTSRPVLDLMLADGREQLKIVATGLKILERQEVKDAVNECPYRLAQEGLPLVLPYVTRQRLELPPELLVSLLRERSLLLPGGEGEEGGTTAAGNPKGVKPSISDTAVLAALDALKFGCVVCELSAADARRLGFAVSAHHSSGAAAAGVVAAAASPAAEGEEATGGLAANAPLAVVAWKGKASLSIMVEKSECAQMIDKLESELKKLEGQDKGEGR